MCPNKLKPPKYNPLTYKTSSLFLLKASYQRHMLIAMLLASLIVVAPILASTYLSDLYIDENTGGDSIEVVPDTVIIDLSLRYDIVIVKDNPPISGRSFDKTPILKNRSGVFLDDIELVPDNIPSEDYLEELGQGNGDELGPDVGDNLEGYGNGWSGSIFIYDTTSYYLSDTLDRIPELIHFVKPDYPPLARRVGIEGKVILQILVDIDGTVSKVVVYSDSNPDLGFGKYASSAAKMAVFSPAIRNNQPVRCWVSLPVVFILEEH